MKNFELLGPRTIEDAIGLLPSGSWADARALVMAGGQDLVSEMKDHLVEPDQVVNLKGIPEMRGVLDLGADVLAIGALTTIAQIERDETLRRGYPLLTESAETVASPQIRTLGTLGGNLCQRPRCWYYRNEHTVCLKKGGDECFSFEGMNKFNAILGGGPTYIVHPSDLAPALIALDARVFVQGPGGERSMPLQDLYVLPAEAEDVTRETVLSPDEVLTFVMFPKARAGWRSTYVKFREKSGFDFALSAVALALRMEGDTIAEARMCLGGVATVPWRCESTERLLVGRKIDDETCRLAGEDALRGAEPLSQNEYKIPLTQGLITKALRKLSEA